MNRTLGVTFSESSQWHSHQRDLIKTIEEQIEACFPNDINLLINMTWFGPQFTNNNEHAKFLEYIHSKPIDNIFLLASEDPCCYNKEETKHLIKDSGASHSFLLGHFNGKFEFNFYSTVINKYFPIYAEQDLLLKQPQYIFINYNRKPHEHRKQLVHMLDSRKLTQFGIITLGNNRNIGETIEEYKEGNWGMPDVYGIPHDIHSLGRLEYWQNHFLNIVSETNFEDHLWTMLTEKTFKPIIGLRPFVINGQLDVYRYLRQNGFKTFNNYWPHINLETCNMDDIHKNICELIIWLQTQNLSQIYLDMLPDLRYNKLRLNEFAIEQQHKMENIFND